MVDTLPKIDLDSVADQEPTGLLLGEPIVTGHVADKIVDRLVTAVALGVYVLDDEDGVERLLGWSGRWGLYCFDGLLGRCLSCCHAMPP